jgi:hypothetical protein
VKDLRDASTLTVDELAEARRLIERTQQRFAWGKGFEPEVRELALIARAYKLLKEPR